MKKEQNSSKKKKLSGVFRIIRKVIYKSLLTVLAFIVIVSLSFIFLSQTKMFRSWFYGKVLELVNENIEGRIEASDIKILPFQGIKISDLRIIAANDTVAKIKKLRLRYSFSPIFNNYLYIKSLTVDNPRIKLLRNSKDSTWNFEHIITPANDTSTGGQLNWVFDVQNITVINGRLIIDDKTQKFSRNNNKYFNINHADFKNINLSLLAKADIPKQEYYLEINKFLVLEKNSNIDIRELGLNAHLDTNGVRLYNVNIRSNQTAIKFNAELNNINPFKTIDSTALTKANLTMTFYADFLNLILANKFIENFPVINDDIKLYGHITGNVANIKLQQFKIEKNKSKIFFSGNASDILSSNPRYKVKISNSNLYDKDFRKIKKAFGIDDINIAHSYIKRIEATGDTKKIKAYMDFQSPYANLVGNAKLNLIRVPEYYAYLKFRHVDLGLLLSDNSLRTNLNGQINLDGKGLETNTLNTGLNLAFNKSRFKDFLIDSLYLQTRVDSNMKVNLGNLFLVLDNYYSDSLIYKYSEKSKLKTSGTLDFSDMTKPKYDLDIEINEFNLASQLKSYLMPQYLDSKIKVTGTGFHPDSLETDFTAAVDNCMFGNRALMPFNLDIHIERFFDYGRQILINSQLFDLELDGEYSISDFAYFADMQIGELVGLIDRKIKTFSQNPTESDTVKIQFDRRKIPAFKNFTMDLTASLHDLTPIGIAVGQPYLSGNADIDLYIDAVDDRTVIDLRKLSVNNFQYKDGQVAIVVNPTSISTQLDIALEDSLAVFKKIDLNLNGRTDSYIDNMQFSQPKLKVRYSNDSVKIALATVLDKSIILNTGGNFIMTPGEYNLILDSTKVAIENLFAWHSLEPVHITLSNEGINFKDFIFTRSTNEMIKLSGVINSTTAKNINLEIKNFPLSELAGVSKGKQKEYFQKIQGKIASLNLNMEDSLVSPKIKCDFTTDYIISDKREIGILNGKADYFDKLLKGKLILTDSSGKVTKLTADIVSLPIDLALKIGGKRILPGQPIDIEIKANNLNVNIANPFIPEIIQDLDGFADIEFNIIGVKDSVDYTGYIETKNVHFLSTANNLFYNASGKINIENEDITFKNFILKNDSKDLKNSKAVINGSLLFSDFNIEKFDFNIKAKSIKLLGMASMKSMPGLYGDFVIRTRNEGIIFSGDLEHPYLKGDIEILNSRLYMPSTESKNQVPVAYFKYKIKGNNLKVEDIPQDSLLTKLFGNIKKDTINAEEKEEELFTKQGHTKSFVDLMKFDLNIWFYMPMQITMDMGGQLGQITAIVATKSPSSPIHYYVDPAKNIATITGSLELKKNSTFNYFKLFNITGSIEFPTGNIDDPRLDLKAVYEGKTTINENIRNYKVILYITGSKNKPVITFDYTLDNEPARGDQAKIREDALFLLMFGLTKSEFESPSSSGGSGISDIGAQGIASALSRSVTEMLSGTGFITSADIDLQGGSFQNAKLKLSGQLLGMTWKVGGTISDIMNGYEFTAEVPLGLLLFPDTFRSLFLSFMTTYNPSQNISRNQKNWEIKLKFGNEF